MTDEWTPHVCVYHEHCDDGFGAAWAIRRRWPECDFVPATHGRRIEPSGVEVDGRNVLFVDFSLSRADLVSLAGRAASVFVIDHHRTAERELEPFRLELEDDETPFPLSVAAQFERIEDRRSGPPILAWFRSDMSGATMAWRFAHGEEPIPAMLSLIEDRDLWRFRYGDDTHRHSAAIGSYPKTFDVWDDLVGRTDDLRIEGVAILRAHRVNLEAILEEAYWTSVGGHFVPVVCAPPMYASDACHELLVQCPEAPFAACWSPLASGGTRWSLRSEDSRTDVSEVARSHGGGGHRNASGFLTGDRTDRA